MKPPIFRPAAAADVEDAYRWDEHQRASLGEEFLTAVNTVIESLVPYPERFPMVYQQTRRANLRRFPYGLFYRIIEDQVIVVAWPDGATRDGGSRALRSTIGLKWAQAPLTRR